MNRGVLHSSLVQQIMAAGNTSWWCYTNGIRAPEEIPSNYSSSFLPPFPSSPPSSSSGWHDVHSQEDLQQSRTQLLRGGLVCEEEEEDADQTGRISSSQAKRVKPWQEQVLLEQAQQEHVSPYVEYVKHENSTNYLYGHPTDERVEAKLSAPTNNWSFLSSSPKSCITSYGTTNNLLNFSNISKSNARHPQQNRSLECNSNVAGVAQKKARLQSSSTQTPFKVKKQKLGDRIAALHQLVSPFGKTDTASVLLEATGYIRFLHRQIETPLFFNSLLNTSSTVKSKSLEVPNELRNSILQWLEALSLPYLSNNSGDFKHKSQVCGDEELESPKDLSSRGLCLVPISCSVYQIGNENVNGADYWAQACLPSGQGGSFC